MRNVDSVEPVSQRKRHCNSNNEMAVLENLLHLYMPDFDFLYMCSRFAFGLKYYAYFLDIFHSMYAQDMIRIFNFPYLIVEIIIGLVCWIVACPK